MQPMNWRNKRATKAAMMTAMAISCLAQAGIAGAEEAKAEEYTLDPIVVTAQRKETKDLDTPASVTVITAEDIKNSGVASVQDLLDRQVGLNSMSYGPMGQEFGGSSNRIKIRSLDKGTLVLVNGTPMNLLNYNGIANIPLDSIEKIEVVKGSNATLYGAEAMAGVINIITKKTAGTSKTTVQTSVGNYLDQWSLTHSDERFLLSYSKEYYDSLDPQSRQFPFGKYKSSSGTTKNSYNTLSKGNKENIFLTANLNDKLTFSLTHSDSDLNRNEVTRYANKADAVTTKYKYNDNRDTATLVYDDKETQLKSTLAFNRRWYTSKSGAPGTNLTLQGGSYTMSTITSDTQKGWTLHDGKDNLIVGLALNRDFFQNYKYAFQKTNRTSSALYSSLTHDFTPKFSTTIGFREEWVNDFDSDQNVFLPQVQTLYKINATTSWYTNVGKSFIMPAMNSYFNTTDAKATQLKKSVGLKPQEGWTYETGIKKISGDSSFKLALFHMDIQNKFAWTNEQALGIGSDTNNNVQINKGDWRNTGIEAEFERQLNQHWQYNLGATLSNPEVNDDGAWVQDDARVQLTAGVTHRMNKWTTNVNYLFLGERNDSYYHEVTSSGNRYYALPNRNLLNANIEYQAGRNDSVSLSLNNILNKTDCINEYENYGLPFNWMLSFKHTF